MGLFGFPAKANTVRAEKHQAYTSIHTLKVNGIQSAMNNEPRWQHKENLRNSITDFKNKICSHGLKEK
jgi:hypothetical protein